MKLLDEMHVYQGKLKLEEVPQLISRINNILHIPTNTCCDLGTKPPPIK